MTRVLLMLGVILGLLACNPGAQKGAAPASLEERWTGVWVCVNGWAYARHVFVVTTGGSAFYHPILGNAAQPLSCRAWRGGQGGKGGE